MQEMADNNKRLMHQIEIMQSEHQQEMQNAMRIINNTTSQLDMVKDQMLKMQDQHEEAIERVRVQSRSRSRTPGPPINKSVTFNAEDLDFQSPENRPSTAASSSSGLVQYAQQDDRLSNVIKEAENRSLERDARNQVKLYELRDIAVKLTQDHFQQADDQFEEGQNEDGSYTEEQIARWYEQAEYVDITQYYDMSAYDSEHEYSKEEWQQWVDSWDESWSAPPPPEGTIQSTAMAGGDPTAIPQTANLNPNVREQVQSEQAAIANPLVPFMAPHLPWMQALQTQIATTNKETLLQTLNTSSTPTDWSSLTAMDACAAAGISPESIPADLKALFEKTPNIVTASTRKCRGRPSAESDNEDEKAKRTVHIKGEENFKFDPLPNNDFNAYRKWRERSLQKIANASGRTI